MQNIFIISGPAGSGKDAIIDGLMPLLPIERVITTTTREPRPKETNGNPYYFVSRDQFEQAIKENRFAEYSTNENGAYYGVTKEELERVAHCGRIGIWRIDWKGVISARKLFPNILAIFISAPIEILESRLRKRDFEKDENYFKERIIYTEEWLKHTDIYDYTIENEEGKLDEAIQKTLSIIEAHAKLA